MGELKSDHVEGFDDAAELPSVHDGIADEPVPVDEATNKKLLRKIDMRLMPVMCFTYALQYYDKAILSQAAIFGLRKDLHLEVGLRYSWVSLIFYFGYLLGCYPISWLAQKYTTAKVCSIICVLWSIVVICTPACKTYAGLLVNRFILGVIESGVSPSFMLTTGVWYTHSEQVFRSGLWYSFSGGSNLISPLINYGLGHITGGALHPWQYMYLIAGLATFFWGIALWFIFPASPKTAKGFTEKEHILLLERVRANNAGAENRHIKWYQVREAVSGYPFWCILFLAMLSTTGSGAVTTFGSIIFHGMGFSTFVSLLLNIPIGALAFICVLGSGYLGRTIPNARLNILTVACAPVIVGCCLLWQLPSSARGARIAGYYLINFFSAAWVQCIALGTSNVAGHTKKATYAAATFFGYSLGNIIGPLTFNANSAPRYDPGFRAMVICFALCAGLAQAFRALLSFDNRKRQKTHGDPTIEHGLEDLTDEENKSFRYHL
ncbi:hypothetical protein LTR10_019043 [Elasticomyces elasticus]|uniref:Major facilitator superfamily (MFS) profile domain-containing protein n=1 Tax=Exophiala sideris TaxID=1016849 RepID=A0ABR0IYV3_9EURO|nr:hypothetical protein LTR10_019043 [Elasticomyces elasticus]KAK5022929.1 hypothetical protein LTS07_009657 [Exophiala sideris]KAK5026392.1 hypothetical protein LTR13_010006 [Exophiala sideris]KAK5052327.1 hypothetical protein LTR69_009863 [Exophiala sideris]KAK5177354.1 hypothetical protein LTR44_010149 [Eurotiomycetes sp. CCFEE 6388]